MRLYILFFSIFFSRSLNPKRGFQKYELPAFNDLILKPAHCTVSRMTPADYVVGTSKEACAPNIGRWWAPRAGLLFWTLLVFARTKQHRLRLGSYPRHPFWRYVFITVVVPCMYFRVLAPHATVVVRIEGPITITSIFIARASTLKCAKCIFVFGLLWLKKKIVS